MIFDAHSGDIARVCKGSEVGSGSQWSREGGQHGDSRDGSAVFSRPNLQCADPRGLICVCFDHRSLMRSAWSFDGEEALGRGGGSGNTPQMFDSNLEFGRCFLSFNLHVVKTISGALRCLHVPHECLPCKSLMSLVFLKKVVVEPYRVGGGSLPLRAKP